MFVLIVVQITREDEVVDVPIRFTSDVKYVDEKIDDKPILNSLQSRLLGEDIEDDENKEVVLIISSPKKIKSAIRLIENDSFDFDVYVDDFGSRDHLYLTFEESLWEDELFLSFLVNYKLIKVKKKHLKPSEIIKNQKEKIGRFAIDFNNIRKNLGLLSFKEQQELINEQKENKKTFFKKNKM